MCELWSHQFGWELHLEGAPDLLQTQVCRRQEDVIDTFEQLEEAMISKGWTRESA